MGGGNQVDGFRSFPLKNWFEIDLQIWFGFQICSLVSFWKQLVFFFSARVEEKVERKQIGLCGALIVFRFCIYAMLICNKYVRFVASRF